MRKRVLCAMAMLAASNSASLGQSARQSGGQGAATLTVIRAGTLIDGASEASRKNQRIFGGGERIEKVGEGGSGRAGGYNLEGDGAELEVPKGAQLVDGPVEARKGARQQLEPGGDWIKVYMTHRSWVDKQGNLVSQPTLTVEELKAIVDETHGWQKKVACHAYNGIGMQRALEGGCDSIEHGLEITDAQIAQMQRQGTWHCPTISPS